MKDQTFTFPLLCSVAEKVKFKIAKHCLVNSQKIVLLAVRLDSLYDSTVEPLTDNQNSSEFYKKKISEFIIVYSFATDKIWRLRIIVRDQEDWKKGRVVTRDKIVKMEPRIVQIYN